MNFNQGRKKLKGRKKLFAICTKLMLVRGTIRILKRFSGVIFFQTSRKSHEVVSKKAKDQCFVVGGRLASSKEKNKSESLRTCFL